MTDEIEIPDHPVPRAAATNGVADRRFGHASDLLEGRAVIGYEASRAIAAEPVAWVWEGIIAAGHAVELCGPSYTGKSTLAILIAVARANPTGKAIDLLGRTVTPMADGKLVVIANEENGKQSAVAKIDAAIQMLRLPARDTWDRIMLLPRARLRAYESSDKDIRHPENLWAGLLHAAKRGQIDLVVLDTRARIFAAFGNPKDEDAQAKAADEITYLVEATGAPVVVISHTRKGGSEDIEDISGSAQRGGGADVVLMLTAERDSGKVLSSKVTFRKLRDGVDEHPEPVTFSTGRSASGTWALAVDGSIAEDEKPAHERVYDLVLQRELSQSQIRAELKMSGKRVGDAVDILKASKRIEFRQTTVKGQKTWLIRAKGGDLAMHKANGLLRSAHTTQIEDRR